MPFMHTFTPFTWDFQVIIGSMSGWCQITSKMHHKIVNTCINGVLKPGVYLQGSMNLNQSYSCITLLLATFSYITTNESIILPYLPYLPYFYSLP